MSDRLVGEKQIDVISRLTRERDEARADAARWHGSFDGVVARLAEAEKERDGLLDALDVEVARAEAAEARVAELEGAAKFAFAALDGDHRSVGMLCGEDVCWLCGAQETLRGVLASLSPTGDADG